MRERPSGQNDACNVPSPVHDTDDDDVLAFDPVQDDVLAHDNAAETGANVVTPSANQGILT